MIEPVQIPRAHFDNSQSKFLVRIFAELGSHHHWVSLDIRYIVYPRKGHYQNSSIIEGLVDLYTSVESSLRIDQSEKPSIDPWNVSTKRLAIFNSSTDIRWVREGHFAKSRDDIIHVWSWMKVIYLYSMYYLLW